MSSPYYLVRRSIDADISEGPGFHKGLAEMADQEG